MSGETGPISVSLPIAMVIAGFFAIAMYNTVEILIWIFSTFVRKKGLYFWSLLVAALGIPVHSIAVLLRFFALAPEILMSVFIVVGWWAMVTGQSLVLYSRLYLVVRDRRKIRWVLIMIIANFCILHMPVSVLFIAVNSGNPAMFIDVFNVYERVQLVGFSIQESILAGLYIWEATHGLKPILDVKGSEGRRMIRHLFILFAAVVLLDASLIVTEYTDNFQIQTTYKPVVYSIKLKIEFVILNELLSITRMDTYSCYCLDDNPDGSSQDQTRSFRILPTTSTVVRDGAQPISCAAAARVRKTRRDHIFDGAIEPAITPDSLQSVKSIPPPADGVIGRWFEYSRGQKSREQCDSSLLINRSQACVLLCLLPMSPALHA